EFTPLMRAIVGVVEPAIVWIMGKNRPAVIVGLIVAALLLSWGPAYLTWPLWVDHDVCAGLAKSWDEGIRPWRDRMTNQFPGEIYLFWGLGHLFGWGRPVTLYAADLALLLTLG